MTLRNNSALSKIGVLLSALATTWSSIAFTQTPAIEPPQIQERCPSLETLIGRARPELAAQGLLRLAEADSGRNATSDQAFIQEAFLKASQSQAISKLRPINAAMTAQIGSTFFGQDLNADSLTLQSRAVEDNVQFDWYKALSEFRSINVKAYPALTCQSSFTYDLAPYFQAATKLLVMQPSGNINVIPFAIQGSMRAAAIPGLLSLLSNSKLSSRDVESTLDLYILGLSSSQSNSSEFFASLRDLATAINRLSKSTGKLPIVVQSSLYGALRDYIVRSLDAPRCSRANFGTDLPLRSNIQTLGELAGAPYSGLSELNQALAAVTEPPITFAEASPTTIDGSDDDSDEQASVPAPIYSQLRELVYNSDRSDDVAFNQRVNTFLSALDRSDVQNSLSDLSDQKVLIKGEVLRLLGDRNTLLRQSLTLQYLLELVGSLHGTPADYPLLMDFTLTQQVMIVKRHSQEAVEWDAAVCNEDQPDLMLMNRLAQVSK